jgi:hypothetical protein
MNNVLRSNGSSICSFLQCKQQNSRTYQLVRALTRWRFDHNTTYFSQQIDYLKVLFIYWKMCLCGLHKLWKYELVLNKPFENYDQNKWRNAMTKNGQKVKGGVFVLFIFLRMCAVLKETFHRDLAADSPSYRTEKIIFQISLLFSCAFR